MPTSTTADARPSPTSTPSASASASTAAPTPRAPRPAGTRTVTAAAHKPQQLLLTSDTVYWTQRSREVMRVPRTGGDPTLVDQQPDPHALTADAAGVYWLMMHGVRRLRPGASEPETVFAMEKVLMHGLASDGSAIYWGAWGGSGFVYALEHRTSQHRWVTGERDEPFVVAASGTDLYIQSNPRNDLVRVAKRGGRRSVVWPTMPEGSLAIGAGFVWATHGGTISRRALTGAGKAVTIASGLFGAASPQFSGGLLYWRDDRGVARVSAGSTAVERPVEEPGVLAFTVDAKELFWATDNEVLAIKLPVGPARP